MQKTKFFSKLAAIILAGAMAVSFTACGSDENNQATPESSAVSTVSGVDLTDAIAIMDNLNNPENINAEMLMDMSIKQGSNTLSMQVKSNITAIGSDKIKMDMDLSMGGQSLSKMESYIITEDGKHTQYTNTDGTWSVTTVDDSTLENQISSATGAAFTKDVMDLKVSKEEATIKDVKTTVLEGTISLDKIADQLDDTLGSLDNINVTMPVKIYVDTAKMQIVKIYIDLQPVLNASMAVESDADNLNITAESAYMEIYMNAVDDAVADFEVPVDALAATSSATK